MSANETDNLLQFVLEYGHAYLASGGPTSRVEDALAGLGKKLGYPTEVFSTPTGVFVSVSDKSGKVQTALNRIKDSSINLSRLCWLEGIFDDLFSEKITVSQARRILHHKTALTPPYSQLQTFLASWVSGFALSFTSYRNMRAAIACAFITVATWWISGPALKEKIGSSIFRDFIGCVLALSLASLVQIFWPAPFDAYTIGALIILVPGLALTTAISELADQNLVSGSAKLMQAVLTLLALGMAYLLFSDLSLSMQASEAFVKIKQESTFLISALGMIVTSVCFGIIFRVPRKSLAWSTLAGFVGWWILRLLRHGEYSVAGSYFASLGVGVLSMFLGYRYKVPSQVFSVPGIISILPGMLAFMSFQSLALGRESHGIELGFKVAITAGSIVFGLFSARIPFAFVSKPW